MPIDPRHPREIRADIRSGKFAGITAGLGPGFVQANMAVLPRDDAYDFLLFCQRNPRPCPLIEVTDVGSVEPVGAAAGADLRTDLPRYRIYKDGVLADEVTDVKAFWRDDLVGFLLGCSFTFEWALMDAGIPLRHVERGCNVSMWKTSIDCRPAGRQSMLVFHMETLHPRSTWRSGMPASMSAHSKVKEQPSRKPTRSSRQKALTSVTSSARTPSL